MRWFTSLFRRQPLADNRRPGWHLDTNASKDQFNPTGFRMVKAHIKEVTPR